MERIELAQKIVELSGGKDNLTNVTACMTRLRFSVVNMEKVDTAALKSLSGVLGTQVKGAQLQVIIGPSVNKLLPLVAELVGNGEEETVKSGDSKRGKLKPKSIMMGMLDYLSAAFAPVIIAIVGAGFILGMNILFIRTFGWYVADSGLGQLLNLLGDVPFHFLPFLLAFSAAKKLNTNIPIALVLAGSYMHPSIINNVGESWNLLGVTIPLINYRATVIPILLSVYLLSHVYKQVDKIVPAAIRIVFVPVLVTLIVVPVSLLVLGPLGFYLSGALANVFVWLFNLNSWVAGFVIGSTRQLVVLTGMHMGLLPVMLENLRVYGHDFLGPVHAMGSMAVAGACLGVFLRAKKVDNKSVSMSAFITAFIGVTEPGVYGVLIRFFKPFIAVIIGGGIGGAFVSGMGAYAVAIAMPSPISIAVYADTIPIMLVGWVISFISACAIAYVLGIDEVTEKV